MDQNFVFFVLCKQHISSCRRVPAAFLFVNMLGGYGILAANGWDLTWFQNYKWLCLMLYRAQAITLAFLRQASHYQPGWRFKWKRKSALAFHLIESLCVSDLILLRPKAIYAFYSQKLSPSDKSWAPCWRKKGWVALLQLGSAVVMQSNHRLL